MFPQISCDRRSYLEIYSILHPHPSHHIRGNLNTRYPPFLPILSIISGAIWTPDIHLSFPFFPSYKGQFKHQTSGPPNLPGATWIQIFFLSFSSIPSFQGQLKHQILILSFLSFQGQYEHQIFLLSFQFLPLFQGQFKHQISIPILQQPFFLNQIFKFYLKIKKYILTLYIKRFNTNLLI